MSDPLDLPAVWDRNMLRRIGALYSMTPTAYEDSADFRARLRQRMKRGYFGT